jgi:hypothetical protein
MANMFLLRTATALAAVASARGQNAPANPEELVNIVGGTQSKEDFSYGNIMPDTTLPWGFNAWAAQTNLDRQWWFASWDRSFYGFRCTHQPSPWIGDYGVLRFSAAIIDKAHQGEKLFSAYDPTKSDWAPYYQNHTLLAWGSRDGYLTVELAPTEHGAVMRFSFPPYVAQTPGGLAPGWNQTRRVWEAGQPHHDERNQPWVCVLAADGWLRPQRTAATSKRQVVLHHNPGAASFVAPCTHCCTA